MSVCSVIGGRTYGMSPITASSTGSGWRPRDLRDHRVYQRLHLMRARPGPVRPVR
ncbi:MAG: hypothetical protein QOF52_3336 [Propionibacteriaceae bacterium]|jgi:hypothetical protein|nr:hypothetical protein [Propionibacteriaceae bacterium]